jgi:hypothetical protein
MEDGSEVGSKRKLTSVVWKEFKRIRWHGKIKAKIHLLQQQAWRRNKGWD